MGKCSQIFFDFFYTFHYILLCECMCVCVHKQDGKKGRETKREDVRCGTLVLCMNIAKFHANPIRQFVINVCQMCAVVDKRGHGSKAISGLRVER